MASPANMELTGRELVVKDLSFIQAGYWLDLVELRLIALAIIVLRKDKAHAEFDPNVPVMLHANVYARMFNTSSSNAYKVLEEATKSLRERRIRWVDVYENKEAAKGRRKAAERLNDLSWTTQCSYIKDMAMVQIWFSPQIIPFLIHLDNNFAGYEIRNLVKLTSPYELRLYELGVAWKNKGLATFNKETLRNRLGIFDPEQFKTASNFNRMLNKAVNRINAETDLTLTFTPQYEKNLGSKGQVVKGYEMKVRVKNSIEMVNSTNLPDPNIDAVPGESEYIEEPKQSQGKTSITDNKFLDNLGQNGELRFDENGPAEVKPKHAPVAKQSRENLTAYPDENGNWDIDFIVAHYNKALFRIVGMDRDNIPDEILRALPEYEKYVGRMGESMALTFTRNIIDKKIAVSIKPGSVKPSNPMDMDSSRKSSKHDIQTLTTNEVNVVLRNPAFRSRYAPQGQSNPVEIDTYLRNKLTGDLSKIPDLKEYL